jgi:hypothetical protein
LTFVKQEQVEAAWGNDALRACQSTVAQSAGC